ncbi:hypothetical protein V6N12_042591 [Hibiscus sabdariffa]|uniref:Uncharacterized protein n=1 Tax=Hibiscus sabdariffa TaxID=183260 RepID=A0ABR2EF92_9ROSI
MDETFKCIEKGTNNLVFPLLITNTCMWHNEPKLDSNKALVVKGTVIMAATWRNLTRVETKEKVSTPKPRAAKSMPATLMPIDSVATLTKVIQYQEAILHKLARLESKNITLWHYLNSRDVCN